MRARTIKPSFFANEDVADCSFFARLAYIGLWAIADREGRLEDRPKRIKALLFPYENVDVESALAELASKHLIHRYAVLEKRYISIPTFCKHQRPHPNEKESEIPAPQENNFYDINVEHQGDKDFEPRCKVLATKEQLNRAVSLSSVSLSSVSQSVVVDEQQPAQRTQSRFRPPTIEEVRAYLTEKNIAIDAERFFAYYEARGWMLGKTKMRNWHAAIVTWEKNEKPNGQHSPQHRQISKQGEFNMDRQKEIFSNVLKTLEAEDAARSA